MKIGRKSKKNGLRKKTSQNMEMIHSFNYLSRMKTSVHHLFLIIAANYYSFESIQALPKGRFARALFV